MEEAETADGERSSQPKRRGRPGKSSIAKGLKTSSSNDSWGAVRRLKLLKLAETRRRYMGQDKAKEAQEIFDSPGGFVSHNVRDEPLTGIIALLFSSQHALSYSKGSLLSNIKYLFTLLVIGDIAIFLYGKGYQGKIMNESRSWMEDRGKGSATSLSRPEPEHGPEEKLKLLTTMTSRGRKLVELCEKFGSGSLFWLQEGLSDHL